MNKLKIKNLITSIAILLIAFILTGCANVDYSRFVYPNGEITDRLVVELDEEKIRNAGVSISVITESIQKDLEDLYIQPIRDFKNNYIHEDHSLEQKQYVNDGIIYDIQIVGNNKIIAEVNFKTVGLFNLYYGITEEELESDDQLEFREGTFVNRYVQSSQNVFSVLKTEQLKNLVKKYELMFSNQFSLSDVKLTQVYASPNTDIKSNANTTEISQGIKMHQWEIDSNNLDFNIEFYTLTPRTGPWYILALFVTFLITFIIYCNLRSRKYKKQKNNNNNNK